MKLLKVVIALLVTVVFLIPNADVFAGDSKYYSGYALKHKLSGQWDIFFTPELRFKNDMGTFYYYYLRGGATLHADKHLDMSLAYRYLQTKDSKGEWDNSDGRYIELIVIPKTTLAGFNLSDANKVEYRMLENARDRWVYRNLATIAYPAKIGDFEFTPYVSNEVYYDFEIEKFNLNETTLGVTKKISPNLSLGMYGRAETTRVGTKSEWDTNFILGTNVGIDF